MSLETFWTTMVVDKFNSALYQPEVDFTYVIGDIDISLPPVAPRNGSYLRTMFYDVRSDFATLHRQFSRSGQFEGTIERFREVVLSSEKGVTARTKKMSSVGNKCMVLYSALCEGPSRARYERLLSFFTKLSFKTLTTGRQVDIGREGGLGDYERRTSSAMNEDNISRADSINSRRRRSSDQFKDSLGKMADTISLTEKKKLDLREKKEEREERIAKLMEASYIRESSVVDQNTVNSKQEDTRATGLLLVEEIVKLGDAINKEKKNEDPDQEVISMLERLRAKRKNEMNAFIDN